jgi:hypothetical protein
MKKIVLFAMIVGFTLTFRSASAKDPGLKAEDLVAKHLASIGTHEAIAAAKSRVAEGKIHFGFESQAGGVDGKQVFASQGDKVHFYIGLQNPNYKGERFIFDGTKISIADITPGIRSSLGEFIHVQDRILREGLWGGVLSTDWALLAADQRHSKLSYGGLKKIDGQELYELRYSPAKHSDLQISLFFEPESFHHVVTVYRVSISPEIARSDIESARQNETTYRLEERFGQFKTFDGLSLPTQWEVRFTEDIPVTANSPSFPNNTSDPAFAIANGPEAGRYNRSATKIWSITEDSITNNVSLDSRNFLVK